MTLQQVLAPILTPFLAPGGAASVPLDDASRGRLRAMASSGDELIFTGIVVPDVGCEPVFRYERRYHRTGDRCVSTHVTYPPDSREPVLAQRAVHSPSHALRHFEEIHSQTGAVSSVEVREDGSLDFTLRRGETTQRRSEGSGAPVIVAPTLFGFALEHWEELTRGAAIQVRFAATEYSRSYDFVLRLRATDERTTTIAFEAASFFVRLAVLPMLITFDTTTKTVVHYVGRVPPRFPDLRMFDAHVDYEFAVAEYR